VQFIRRLWRRTRTRHSQTPPSQQPAVHPKACSLLPAKGKGGLIQAIQATHSLNCGDQSINPSDFLPSYLASAQRTSHFSQLYPMLEQHEGTFDPSRNPPRSLSLMATAKKKNVTSTERKLFQSLRT
jgi:hypothetical protein